VEEEEQGFRLPPSEYLNTIRQVDKEFRGMLLAFSTLQQYH
jgi:hypothetical protein